MFGGFTGAAWSSASNYSTDSTAFIFSLRGNGISFSEKYMVRNETTAILNCPTCGPVFGSYVGSFFSS